MGERPGADLFRRGERVGVEIGELEQREQGLRHAVRVDRVGAIVEIAGRTIFADEMCAVKTVTAAYRFGELVARTVARQRPQRRQIEAGVEVVDPTLRGAFAVGPGTVG